MRRANIGSAEKAQTFLTEKNRLKRYALWMLLFVICAGTYWFSHWETERHPNPRVSAHYPSFVITNFNTNAYDEKGQLSYQLSAATLTHFDHNGQSHLEHPQFTSIGETKGSSWRTTAQKGLVIDESEQILLRSQVKVTTHSPEPHTYHIQTSALDLLPKEKLAITNEPVTISQAHHHIHSRGMVADWHKGELQLLEEVKGRYDTTVLK